MAEVETNFCNNCKKQISASNFMMHEVHCKRHIALCGHCSEPIPKGEMEVHFEENHAKIPCPKCGVEVEKMQLEDHEDNSCKKKPMDCVYCELKFPKDEFDAHIDYCGSRTEQCPKCGQYIKLRDQTKHEESKCRFPEVKPSNTDRPAPNNGYMNGQGNEYLAGLPGMNPFALDELSRVLGPVGDARSQASSHNASAAVRQEVGATAQDKRRARQNATVKKVYKTNQKSDLNRQRGQGGQGLSPKENDYDHLLAMHLAQDLNPDDDLDALMKAFQKPKTGQSPTFPEDRFMHNRNRFSEDMVMIPCEFCGEPFTADDLVQHQSGCSLDRISDVLPTLISSNNRTDGFNNAGGRDGDRSPNISPPAIIDNLRNFRAEPWLNDDTAMYQNNMDDDVMMLPCEFCDMLFPMDSLVQHQAMCDANATETPRVRTPAADPPIHRPKPKKRAPLSHAIESEFPNLSSRHHQPPPTLAQDNFDRDDSDDDGGNFRPNKYTIGATHRVRKPTTAGSSNTNTSPTSPTEKIRSTMKKYGAESVDRGDYYTRQRGNSRQSANSDTDSWLQSSAQVHKYRPSQGNSRTKSTLDSLLHDSDQSASSHDLLGHIGASRKPQVNPAVRKVTGAANKAPVKTRATAKDVHREMSRGATSYSSTSNSQNRTNKPNFEVRVRPSEADELSPVVTSQRRTRANNVFGGSSTATKPTRNTKRRTDPS